MAEASVPQDLSLAKFVLYHVLIFDKSCEKRGTVYLYSLQYYDFILQNLTRKTAEIVFAGIYNSKFSGGACPRTPLECLAPSALVTRPPKTITLATPLNYCDFSYHKPCLNNMHDY